MKTIRHFAALKRLILVGCVIGLIIFSYTSGQKAFMKELRLQSEQRIANDIFLLQEDISDINRARALSTDIAVTDLGSLRLHAGAMYNHIHEEYDHQMASEYENSFNHLYHFAWYVETENACDLLSSEFLEISSPILSLRADGEIAAGIILQQLENELLSESGKETLHALMFSETPKPEGDRSAEWSSRRACHLKTDVVK